MRLLLTCPQGQVSGEKGRRHLLTRPWGRISAAPHKTWVFPLTYPSSFLRPWDNFGLALSVTAAPCQRLGCRLGRPLGNVPPGRSGPEERAKPRLPLWGALVPSGHRSALDRAGRREWTRVSEDGEGKLPASPAAPVAIALAGASAPVASFFSGYRPLRSRARSKLF